MAIIPNEEKVFMVSNGTNTTFSGSAATKAMQEWYTMDDVLSTVEFNVPASPITIINDNTLASSGISEVMTLADNSILFGLNAGAFANGYGLNYMGKYSGESSSQQNANFFGESSGQLANGFDNNYLGFGSGVQANGDRNNYLGHTAGNNSSGSDVNAFGENAASSNQGSNVNAFGNAAGISNALNGQTIFSNTSLPSFADRATAESTITNINGASFDCTYLYYNETTFAIEGIRL